jgi:hypothetical protein
MEKNKKRSASFRRGALVWRSAGNSSLYRCPTAEFNTTTTFNTITNRKNNIKAIKFNLPYNFAITFLLNYRKFCDSCIFLKSAAKVLHQTAKSCQYVKENYKKCIFSA